MQSGMLPKSDSIHSKIKPDSPRQILQNIPMPNGLTDNDFAALAAESFRALDDESQRANHNQVLADLEASAEDEAAGRLRDAEVVMAEMAEKFNLSN